MAIVHGCVCLSIPDDVLDIVENILYISADEAKEVPEPSGDNVQNMASGNDTYAVVSKGDFPGNDASVYAEVNKTKKKREHQDSFFLEFCGILNIATSFEASVFHQHMSNK